MIISHKSRFIFIHIQKTAGTSIEQELSNRSIPGVEVHSVEVGSGAARKHDGILDTLEKERQEGRYVSDYFAWTIVRNPFERVVSGYYH